MKGLDQSSVSREGDAEDREPLRLLTLLHAFRRELDGFDFEGSTELDVCQARDRIVRIMEQPDSDLETKNLYVLFLPWVDEIRGAKQRELRLIFIGMLRWINVSLEKLEPHRDHELEATNMLALGESHV